VPPGDKGPGLTGGLPGVLGVTGLRGGGEEKVELVTYKKYELRQALPCKASSSFKSPPSVCLGL